MNKKEIKLYVLEKLNQQDFATWALAGQLKMKTCKLRLIMIELESLGLVTRSMMGNVNNIVWKLTKQG